MYLRRERGPVRTSLTVEQVNHILSERTPEAPRDMAGYGVSEHTEGWSRNLFWERYLKAAGVIDGLNCFC